MFESLASASHFVAALPLNITAPRGFIAELHPRCATADRRVLPGERRV